MPASMPNTNLGEPDEWVALVAIGSDAGARQTFAVSNKERAARHHYEEVARTDEASENVIYVAAGQAVRLRTGSWCLQCLDSILRQT